MSFIHVLIRKENKVYAAALHYRTVLRLLESGMGSALRFLKGKYADAGYIVIDCDAKTIVNAQDAIAIPENIRMEIVEVK